MDRVNASSARGRRMQRLRSVRRRLVRYVPFLVGTSVVALLFLGYVAGRGYQADRDAARAANTLSRVDADLRAGNVTQARRDAATAARLARSASHDTGGLAWGFAAHIPGLRGPVQTTRTVASAVDDVARRVVTPIVDLPAADVGSNLHGVSFDLDPLLSAAPVVAEAHARVDRDLSLLSRRSRVGVPVLDEHITVARQRLASLDAQLATLDAALQVAPAMLSDGRRYLILVQNNAESRATGGLIGAYALVHVAGSQLVLDRAGPNNDLHDAPTPAIRTDASFDRRYAGLGVTTSWRSLNLTPDFPSAAQTAAGLWQRQGLPPVDGVVAVDPPALAALLGVAGSVRVPGGPLLTSDNAVVYLESGIYRDFPRMADAARNRYLADVTGAAFAALQSRDVNGQKLLRAMANSASVGHIQLWSAHGDEESTLAQTTIGGALPGRHAPFLEVVTQNLTGGKVDYYLRRNITYEASPVVTADDVGAGPVPMQDATITVRLTNTAPKAGLPAYVTLRADQPHPSAGPVGTDKLWVSLYFAGGTGYTTATLDGVPAALHTDDDAGASVMSTVVELAPGQTQTLVVRVSQPAPVGASFRYIPQPLAVPDQVTVRVG